MRINIPSATLPPRKRALASYQPPPVTSTVRWIHFVDPLCEVSTAKRPESLKPLPDESVPATSPERPAAMALAAVG